MVLNKVHDKINMIVMTGESNAGKSFWYESLKPDIHSVGIAGKNSVFMWQDCVHKRMIVCEEAMLTPETVETFKILAGGQEHKVDIKCKAPKVIRRTPMLVASNYNLSRLVPSADPHLRNRGFFYENLKKSAILEEIGHTKIDTFLWTCLFQFIAQYHDCANEIIQDIVEIPPVDLTSQWVSGFQAYLVNLGSGY